MYENGDRFTIVLPDRRAFDDLLFERLAGLDRNGEEYRLALLEAEREFKNHIIQPYLRPGSGEASSATLTYRNLNGEPVQVAYSRSAHCGFMFNRIDSGQCFGFDQWGYDEWRYTIFRIEGVIQSRD